MCVMFSSFYLNRSNEKYKLVTCCPNRSLYIYVPNTLSCGLSVWITSLPSKTHYTCSHPHMLTHLHTCTSTHLHIHTSTQHTSVLFQLQTLNILSACSTSVAIETRVSVQHGCRVHHTDHTHQGPSIFHVYEHQGDL